MSGKKSEDARTMMESIFNKLDSFLKTETVIGEPLAIGSVQLIPIISVAFGVGGGLGGEKDQKGKDSEGGGGGLGCRITPNAILVIKGEEVELIQLKDRGSLEKLFDAMPEIISQLGLGKKDPPAQDQNDSKE